MRIAIDAMGGDLGPSVIVDGALIAARHLQIGLLFAGAAPAIESELSRHPAAGGPAAAGDDRLESPASRA